MQFVKRWINRIVTTILFLLLIGVGTLVVVTNLSGGEPEVFGYQIKTVLSGSMEPVFQTGSVIAVKAVADKDQLQEGQIITFMEEDNKLITHRIVERTETSNAVLYTTKGDNNNAVDTNPVLSENVVASYTGLTIPYLGYFANFAQSPNGSIFLLIIPGVLLLGYSVISIWMTIRKLEEKKEPANV